MHVLIAVAQRTSAIPVGLAGARPVVAVAADVLDSSLADLLRCPLIHSNKAEPPWSKPSRNGLRSRVLLALLRV